jgi:roadblock/LC7 domain-containing protein
MTRLTATRRRKTGRITAEGASRRVPKSMMLQIPTGGLDAVSPLTSMPQDKAIRLRNWFPQLRYIEVRRGFTEHCDTGETGQPVETIMAYMAAGGVSSRMFAAVNGKVFDVTTASASSSLTSLTNDRWQHTMFATSGGNFLVMCNGADGVRYFDGANWNTASITGVTAASLIHIAAFKSRLWFVEDGSTDAWFLPPDSLQGAASRFPVGANFKKGGYLQAIATWALDGGDGPDDRIAFISSQGEVAVFAGTDPTNASSFSLQGTYEIGAPIGRRCWLKVGGDVAIICMDGVVPLSKAMVIERGAAITVALTANIQPLLNADAQSFRDVFGWQLMSYPLGTRAILNVPLLENETAKQYVMNTVSGAWCEFDAHNANCWELFEEMPYFGGNDGVVYVADTGGSDNGDPITAEMQGALPMAERPPSRCSASLGHSSSQTATFPPASA